MDFDDYIYPIECLRERVHVLSDIGEHLYQRRHADESFNNLVSEITDSSNWINSELFELTKLAHKNYPNDDYEFYAIPQFKSGFWGVVKIIHYILFKRSLGVAEAKKDLIKRFYIVSNQIGYFEEQLKLYG